MFNLLGKKGKNFELDRYYWKIIWIRGLNKNIMCNKVMFIRLKKVKDNFV